MKNGLNVRYWRVDLYGRVTISKGRSPKLYPYGNTSPFFLCSGKQREGTSNLGSRTFPPSLPVSLIWHEADMPSQPDDVRSPAQNRQAATA